MKLGLVSLVFAVSLVPTGDLLGEMTTAMGAIDALGRDRGEAFQDNVLQIIGVGGVDQPPVWRILTKDPFQPGAIRDFAIENGKVVGDQFVPPAYHQRVPSVVLRKGNVKIDSRSVFLIANDRARLAKIGFYTLDYEVRSTERGGGIWVVRLNGAKRGRVGEVIISASDGAVLRERWWKPEPAGAGAVQGGAEKRIQATSNTVGDQINEGWESAKKRFVQGKEEVRKNAEKAGNSVQKFFNDVLSAPADGGTGLSGGNRTAGFGYRGDRPRDSRIDAGRYH